MAPHDRLLSVFRVSESEQGLQNTIHFISLRRLILVFNHHQRGCALSLYALHDTPHAPEDALRTTPYKADSHYASERTPLRSIT